MPNKQQTREQSMIERLVHMCSYVFILVQSHDIISWCVGVFHIPSKLTLSVLYPMWHHKYSINTCLFYSNTSFVPTTLLKCKTNNRLATQSMIESLVHVCSYVFILVQSHDIISWCVGVFHIPSKLTLSVIKVVFLKNGIILAMKVIEIWIYPRVYKLRS